MTFIYTALLIRVKDITENTQIGQKPNTKRIQNQNVLKWSITSSKICSPTDHTFLIEFYIRFFETPTPTAKLLFPDKTPAGQALPQNL